MQAVRQIIDSSLLDTIIQLPETLKRKKVEVIVLPAPQENEKEEFKPTMTRSQLEESFKGSLIESLSNMIPIDVKDMTRDEIRTERLAKYADFN